MPLNIKDKKSGIYYLDVARRMSQLGAAGMPTSAINASVIGPTAAYWQNMIQPLASGDQYNLACTGPRDVPGVTPLFTSDPVQAMYDLFACGGGPFGDPTPDPSVRVLATKPLPWPNSIIGDRISPAPPESLAREITTTRRFSVLTLSSTASSTRYLRGGRWAMPTTTRCKSASQARFTGLQFDFNYTCSKSIDLASDADRVTPIAAWLRHWRDRELLGPQPIQGRIGLRYYPPVQCELGCGVAVW